MRLDEEEMKDLRVRISGTSGQGIISSGDILSYATARKGYYLTTYRSFPSEIRGDGKCYYQLRISEDKAMTVSEKCDILLAIDDTTLFEGINIVADGGIVLYDSDVIKTELTVNSNIIVYPLPLTTIANDVATSRSRNMVGLGVIVGLIENLNLTEQVIKDIQNRYKTKSQDIIDANIKAFQAGIDYVHNDLKRFDQYSTVEMKPSGSKLIMSGNEAIGLAALAAGCRFFAGYPITPATEIMEWLAKELPKFGGRMLQCEDEIAAINYAIGASYGGVKSMTATSGPGLSLMQEAIGLTSMAELPLVIVDVQRGGPSTGIPTKTEQSDLCSAIFGTHGDCPKIVLAPMNVQDCFYQTINAFNFAEEYQVPVILLSDASLGPRRECVDIIDLENLQLTERQKFVIEEGAEYLRYLDTESGISPISSPSDIGGAYTATGLEHSADCTPTATPIVHKTMTEKRFRKLETATHHFSSPRKFGNADSNIGVISWGSTCGAVLEAINLAEEKGYRIEALYPRTLYPFPTQWIKEFIKDKDIVIVIEANYNAQFKSTIVERCVNLNKGIDVIEFLKYDGNPFSAGEIFEEIEKAVSANAIKRSLLTNKPSHF